MVKEIASRNMDLLDILMEPILNDKTEFIEPASLFDVILSKIITHETFDILRLYYLNNVPLIGIICSDYNQFKNFTTFKMSTLKWFDDSINETVWILLYMATVKYICKDILHCPCYDMAIFFDESYTTLPEQIIRQLDCSNKSFNYLYNEAQVLNKV